MTPPVIRQGKVLVQEYQSYNLWPKKLLLPQGARGICLGGGMDPREGEGKFIGLGFLDFQSGYNFYSIKFGERLLSRTVVMKKGYNVEFFYIGTLV